MQICRTRFKKNIVTEFVPPPDRKSRKVMIFCSGIPSAPCKDEVLWFWATKGYWTFFPRYRGTWESGGDFLKHSPEKDVLDVISSLSAPFTDYWTGQKYRLNPQDITVVGSSFGGPAAILASRDPRVARAICVSPVVDWIEENKTDPLKNLFTLLKDAYGPVYRLSKSNWNKLSNGQFYNPVHYREELDGEKILIFHATNDKIVHFKPVLRFAKEIQCHFVLLKRGGHLSSTLLGQKEHYRQVKKFLTHRRT